MACEISQGRQEPCKNVVGGIQALYFINYDATDEFTKDPDGTITAINQSGGVTPVDAYKYYVRHGADLTQNIQSDRNTGTTVFEQLVNCTFKGMSQVLNNELKLLAYGRPRIIVEDNNGNAWLAGEKFGCDLTAGTLVTGNAMTDLYGHTATFSGMEGEQANAVTDIATAVNVIEPV